VAELEGKTALITGANTGIGAETARALAGRGAKLFLACRSEAKTTPVIQAIVAQTGNHDVTFLPLDLGDLASVRACATAFLDKGEPLHVLINNAGVAGHRGTTKSGFEVMFGTNHVGHFLLTALLLERVRASAPARIVIVSSIGHYNAKGIDFETVRRPTRTITGMREYCVSKLANVLHAQELARRLHDDRVTTYALHPGSVATDIWRRVPWPVRPLLTRNMLPPAEGARTSIYCATAPELAEETGLYYDNERPKQPSAVATRELARELWNRSNDWVAQG
jgi:NAD(P)-dependent dehydrogenase (short-subunit alcohol dehydrogenase family)